MPETNTKMPETNIMYRVICLLLLFCVGSSVSQECTYTNPVFEDGRDPKLGFRNEEYFLILPNDEINRYQVYKTNSLADLGEPKDLPHHIPLAAPIYLDSLNGHQINKWYMFGPGVWECNGGDPYTGTWSLKHDLFGLDQFRFDYKAFLYKGRLFLAWAGTEEDRSDWWFESVFVSEIFYDGSSFSMPVSRASYSNMVAAHSLIPDNVTEEYDIARFNESDVIVEAPAVYKPSQFGINDRDDELFMVLALDGAHTNYYAMGVLYFIGSTPDEVTSPGSWRIARVDGREKIYRSHNEDQTPTDLADKGIKGPGVAALTPFNSKPWMFYHSKKHDHFDRTTSSDYDYERRIMLQEIGWMTYEGKLIPDFYDKPIVGIDETGAISCPDTGGEDVDISTGPVSSQQALKQNTVKITSGNNLRITLDRKSKIGVRIFDLKGRTVFPMHKSSEKTAVHIVPIRKADLRSGIYIVKVNIGESDHVSVLAKISLSE